MGDQVKPNFFLAGASKSGTTSLYHYLKSHPDIFFPDNKEPKYFAFKEHRLDFQGTKTALEQIKNSTITHEKDYLELYKDAIGYIIIGDASPIYMHSPDAALNIFKFNNESRFLFILRNPVDRLISDWQHQVNMGFEPIRNIEYAIDAWEQKRVDINYIPYLNYIPKGYYFENLKRFSDLFGNDKLMIITFDQFKSETRNSLKKILKFLKLPDFEFDTSEVFMKGKPVIKNEKYRYLLKLMQNTFFESGLRKMIESNPKNSKKLIKKLYKYYNTDMLKLSAHFDIDITPWKYENYIASIQK